ncbi:hypothetical protein [Candidatus Chromulinivorax destructor]|uniref:Uncharacterized protein n=1 Tax=Candidatus Chromulinivorax destructor TaxID=2066483 RepID=A0A345ZC40_9BACT|nr:hypothetical protein [Candidatus Chromulinivorax destructor]AXK60857.1 hypothetical protein C0J27_03880 [Candidatus Chromulinivorax destructor]
MKNNKIIVSIVLFFIGAQYYAAQKDLSITDDVYDNSSSLLHDLLLSDGDYQKKSFETDQDAVQIFLQDWDEFSENEKAIELVSQLGQPDNILEPDKNLEFLVNLVPDKQQELVGQVQKNLEKKEEKSRSLKFNDLHVNAIKKILESNNMSIDAFNELSRERKITLLLQLASEDRAQLPEAEQEALSKLEEHRKKKLRLERERKLKRKLHTLSQNEETIGLVGEFAQGDNVLESDDKLEFVLNLSPEELDQLLGQAQQDLENSQKSMV